MEIALAKYRFPLFDKDGDDYVSAKELGAVVEKLCGRKPLTPKHEAKVKQGLVNYDTNGRK